MYLAGTKGYKFSIRPTIKLYDKTPQQLDLNIYVGSDWAGCHQTRRSTTGFVIEILGTCIHFESRTQGVVALSSAEVYATGTGAQEALYIRNFIMEALNTKRMQENLWQQDKEYQNEQSTSNSSSCSSRTSSKGAWYHYTSYQPKKTQQTSSQNTWEKKCWDGSSTALASTHVETKQQQVSPVSPVCVTSIHPAYRHQAVWLAMVKQTTAAILNFLTHWAFFKKYLHD